MFLKKYVHIYCEDPDQIPSSLEPDMDPGSRIGNYTLVKSSTQLFIFTYYVRGYYVYSVHVFCKYREYVTCDIYCEDPDQIPSSLGPDMDPGSRISNYTLVKSSTQLFIFTYYVKGCYEYSVHEFCR